MSDQISANNQSHVDNQSTPYSPYTTVDGMAMRHPGAVTVGGLRSKIFYEGDALIKAGAVIKDGRKIIIHEGKYFEYLANESKRKLESAA